MSALKILVGLGIGILAALLVLAVTSVFLVWIPRRRERRIVKERLQRIAIMGGEDV